MRLVMDKAELCCCPSNIMMQEYQIHYHVLWILIFKKVDCFSFFHPLTCPLFSYLLESHHNLQSSSTRVTKVLAKCLIQRVSDISCYGFAIIYHMSKYFPFKRLANLPLSQDSLSPRSYSVGANTKKSSNTAALTKQASSMHIK